MSLPAIATIVVATIILAVFFLYIVPGKHNIKNRNTASTALFIVVILFFAAAVAMVFPMYEDYVSGLGSRRGAGHSALALSIHHAMRLFVLDGEMSVFYEYTLHLPDKIRGIYLALGAVVYVVCPVLTFGAILSFFEDVSAGWSLAIRRRARKYIFSELTDKSLSLAKSIKDENKNALVVFADVNRSKEDRDDILLIQARQIKALCFSKEIAALHLRYGEDITMFLISNDTDKNVKQGMQIVEQYRTAKNFLLHIFASDAESELLFQKCDASGIRIRRIREPLILVNQVLNETGPQLFKSAVPICDLKNPTEIIAPDSPDDKLISAVIFGMGEYGVEMLKALSWFGQMTGYSLKISAFDRDNAGRDRMMIECPELMSPQFNKKKIAGESQYYIDIHGQTEVFSAQCEGILENLPCITYAFVSLGDDALNIKAATRLRELCERQNWDPVIYAVVHDPVKARALENISNFKEQEYRINFIGDLSTLYSQNSMLHSELEQQALARHLTWGAEDHFWKYEYNYCASIASVLHQRVKIACGVPGADIPILKRTEEQRENLRLIEHRRWNAYMRSVGYRYSGSRDKKTRNDLAKLHHDLVPYDILSEADKAKDDVE